MIILDEIELGTPEWFAARIGLPSASHAHEILSRTGKVSKQREAYIEHLAWERIIGTAEETYKNDAMQEGNDMEDHSRSIYESSHMVEITQVGCVLNDEKTALCSPDGLIFDIEEGYETKRATKRKVQTERLIKQQPDNEHWCQMQFSMMVTGWKAWRYHSHHAELPPLFLRIERDEKYISALQTELDKFNDDLSSTVERFRRF